MYALEESVVKLKLLQMKRVWSALKYLYLWMRQKAVATILNWRIIKKNELFSYALVS